MNDVKNFEHRSIIEDVGLTSIGSCVGGRGIPVEIKCDRRWIDRREARLTFIDNCRYGCGRTDVMSRECERIPILDDGLSMIGNCSCGTNVSITCG